MKTTTSTKYQTVRDKLESSIRSGEFATGDQLPAEQTLAEQYGVSLMTARRVVCDLVAADLLERRARKGTFVRQNAARRVTTTTLNLVVPAYDTSFQRTFLNQGMKLAEQKGWRGNVIRLSPGEQDAAVRAIQEGELALMMMEEVHAQSALGLAIRGAKGRVVFLGRDMTKMGVPSIYVESRRSMELAVEHLQNLGHRQIRLITQELSESADATHRLSWRKATAGIYAEADAESHMIHLATPDFCCPSFDAFFAVRQLLAETDLPSGLVCFGEEITQGALAACRAAGYNVPATMSVVNILDAPSMIFSNPPVTSVDVDFEKQIKLALEILELAQNGVVPQPTLHVVEPVLLERESVAPPGVTPAVA